MNFPYANAQIILTPSSLGDVITPLVTLRYNIFGSAHQVVVY